MKANIKIAVFASLLCTALVGVSTFVNADSSTGAGSECFRPESKLNCGDGCKNVICDNELLSDCRKNDSDSNIDCRFCNPAKIAEVIERECAGKFPCSYEPEFDAACSVNACGAPCLSPDNCQGGDNECRYCQPTAEFKDGVKIINASNLGVCVNGDYPTGTCGAICKTNADCLDEKGKDITATVNGTKFTCNTCTYEKGNSGTKICKAKTEQTATVRNTAVVVCGDSYVVTTGSGSNATSTTYQNCKQQATVGTCAGIVSSTSGCSSPGVSKCFDSMIAPLTTYSTEKKQFLAGSQITSTSFSGVFTGAGGTIDIRKANASGAQKYVGQCEGGVPGNCTTSCEVGRQLYGAGDSRAQSLCTMLHQVGTQQNYQESFYLDENCNVFQPTAEQLRFMDLSKFTIFTLSPISLVWDENDVKPVVLQFPLGATDSKKFVIWQASASKPLLVWDPKNTGKITNGTQLFGTAAFGKKWANGYAALASLDKNADGKLSGKELEGIALWFDKNQNGKSEKGEVVTLESVGVKELFFKVSGDNAVTGSIIADIGYSRTDKDGVILGKSLDWFSAEFDTKGEAQKALDGWDQAFNEVFNKKEFSPFTGAWVWTNRNDTAGKPTGVLIISNDNGKITGLSIAETVVNENPMGIKTAILRNPLQDTKYTEKDGKKELTFTVSANGVITSTTVELASSGNALYGVSRSEFVNDKGEKEFANYTWEAKPL